MTPSRTINSCNASFYRRDDELKIMSRHSRTFWNKTTYCDRRMNFFSYWLITVNEFLSDFLACKRKIILHDKQMMTGGYGGWCWCEEHIIYYYFAAHQRVTPEWCIIDVWNVLRSFLNRDSSLQWDGFNFLGSEWGL